MILLCVAVRDRTAQFFFPPFYVRTAVEATRTFERLINDPNRTGSRAEYDLLHLANFDDQSGELEPLPVQTHLANGQDFQQPTA